MPNTTWKVRRAPVINTEITVPGDKSISHRAIMFSALANGPCVIRGFLPGEDCHSTMKAFRALGVKIEEHDETTLTVYGTKGVFTAPTGDLDCGNSGTTMRLMSGILAAQPFRTRLVGDASLSNRPMRRIMEPLGRMGAKISAEGQDGRPPLVIEGGALQPMDFVSPVASAQVKSAVLLAGHFTKGKTSVTEPEQSRDHTERMLQYFLVRLEKEGLKVSLEGGQTLESRDFNVPGDISSAAFWLVAAAVQPGSRLLVTNVGLNPTRTGILAILLRMGAHIKEVITNDEAEPMGTVEIQGGQLHGIEIGGDIIPNIIDEIPAIAIAAALAKGTTTISGARELRVKETDRIAAIASNLRAMGANVEEREDGMVIHGGAPLTGAKIASFGDHRIAMSFAVAGLFAEGETVIEDTACVATSYPTFYKTLLGVMMPDHVEKTPVVSSLSAS